MGIWSEELCKMFLIVGLFLPFSSLFLFVSIHLNLLSIPTGGKGQGRAGRNETGLDQHGRRQKRWTVRGGGGQGRPTGTFLSCLNAFYSLLLLILLLSGCLFLQSTTTGRVGQGMTNAGRTTYRLHLPREVRGARVHVPLFFVLYSPLLFSYCSYFPIISFFAKINNRRAGVGPDRTNAVGNINVGRD